MPDWVSAKDVILEMVRRHSVAGGVGKIIEYYGPGLACLSAMDRHVIANMGAELGATTTVFPADAAVQRFLDSQRRGHDWVEIVADTTATYDINDEINLSELEPLPQMGLLGKLIRAGARLHQAGCNGCIGMGQAPATGRISLRTVPRNFPGRSGTPEDQVYLCSPETATASVLTGVITDPRCLGREYPRFVEPARVQINTEMLVPPAPAGEQVELVKRPNAEADSTATQTCARPVITASAHQELCWFDSFLTTGEQRYCCLHQEQAIARSPGPALAAAP